MSVQNHFYKNVEVKINQNFKNVLRSRYSSDCESINKVLILLICILNDTHKKVTKMLI